MNRILLVVSLWALTGCGLDLTFSPTGLGGDNEVSPGLERGAALEGFAQCSDLEAGMKQRLANQMRVELTQSLRYALQYYAAGYYPYGGSTQDAGTASGAGGGSGTGGGSGASNPTDVTTTNTQIAGVDEPDFVKNDGNRIFVLSKGKLYAARSWPADALAVQSSLALTGSAQEMFLDGDTVVVFSGSGQWDNSSTLATVIDVSDLTHLKITGNYEVPGYYRSARRVGTSVRLVTSRYFYWPLGMQTWLPYGQKWASEADVRKAFSNLYFENLAKIRDAKLGDYLPTSQWHSGGAVKKFGVDCATVLLSTGYSHLGYSAVSTFRTDAPGQLQQQVIFENADEIYADEDSLYFTSHHWWWWNEAGQKPGTYVHKFDTHAADSAKYVASGVVDGYLVDQFSMDEWKGYLRVAATTWNPSAWNDTTNKISVLGQVGARLELVGESEPIGKGERITSARFLGDLGYVVTFRQTDPLFVFDLKNPARPVKVGELKVPGFSSYIHPLDATHLLTIGTYRPENGAWSASRVQLAIFDVSDLSAPRQTHLQLLGDASAYSEAQNEHKAFNYFPARKLLAVPFYDWNYGSSASGYWYELRSDLRVFSVDAELGFTDKGSVSMSDLDARTNHYSWEAIVRRSVMADDFVYAISSAGIRVANIASLGAPIATAKFQ